MATDELHGLLATMQEKVLAVLAHGGARKEVWQVIVEHPGYRPRLYQAVNSFLYTRRDDTVLSDDLASEVTVILSYRFRGQEPFPWKPTGEFTHWFGVVLANACRDACERLTRHQSSERQLTEEDWHAAVAARSMSVSECHTRSARVREAIVSLDEPCRTLLYRWLFEGAQQKEIAREMRRSASWLTTMKKRCIVLLKTYLGIAQEADT